MNLLIFDFSGFSIGFFVQGFSQCDYDEIIDHEESNSFGTTRLASVRFEFILKSTSPEESDGGSDRFFTEMSRIEFSDFNLSLD